MDSQDVGGEWWDGHDLQVDVVDTGREGCHRYQLGRQLSP